MTEQEALDMLKQYHTGDVESDHCNADNILCRFLIELGYQKIVDEFNSIEKWYA